MNPPPVPPECGHSASTGLLAGMRRQEQYDEEAARREPLLGGDGGDPDGGGGASRRQSGEEAGFSRGLSPGRGLSPDRVVSSTPGGAIRLTKRASTVDRVRGKAVAGRWHALGSSEMLVQKQGRCGAVRVRPTPTMTPVWQPAWHARFQGLWGQWHSPPACRCNCPLPLLAPPPRQDEGGEEEHQGLVLKDPGDEKQDEDAVREVRSFRGGGFACDTEMAATGPPPESCCLCCCSTADCHGWSRSCSCRCPSVPCRPIAWFLCRLTAADGD